MPDTVQSATINANIKIPAISRPSYGNTSLWTQVPSTQSKYG